MVHFLVEVCHRETGATLVSAGSSLLVWYFRKVANIGEAGVQGNRGEDSNRSRLNVKNLKVTEASPSFSGVPLPA